MFRKPPSRRPPRSRAGRTPPPRAPRSAGRDLPIAILTGVLLGGLVVGLLFVGAEAFYAFVSLVVLLAQGEFYRAARHGGYSPATALGLGAGAVLLVGVFLQGEAAAPLVVMAALLGSFLWFMVGERQPEMLANVAVTLLGLIYIPLLGSFVGLLAARPDGRNLTILAIGATAVYDIFAYTGGSMLGRHKMAPSISPNKSWEGTAVATLATVGALAWLGPVLGPFTVGQAAATGGAIAVAAPLGDLFESLVKRDLGIKDMGAILPGHGGALDRIDAMLFVVPVVYLALQVLGL